LDYQTTDNSTEDIMLASLTYQRITEA